MLYACLSIYCVHVFSLHEHYNVLPQLCESINFVQMENIGNFLDACEAYGVNKLDLFQTVTLFEGTNMPQVRINHYT